MKTRKWISALCAVALLLSALPAASAVDTEEANGISVAFCAQVEEFLLNAGAEYNISNYDDIFLGGEIPAYCVEGETGVWNRHPFTIIRF